MAQLAALHLSFLPGSGRDRQCYWVRQGLRILRADRALPTLKTQSWLTIIFIERHLYAARRWLAATYALKRLSRTVSESGQRLWIHPTLSIRTSSDLDLTFSR